jgi:hypothetical protein
LCPEDEDYIQPDADQSERLDGTEGNGVYDYGEEFVDDNLDGEFDDLSDEELYDEENELLDKDSVEEAKPYKGDKEKLSLMKKWNVRADSLLGRAIRIAVDMGGDMTGAVKKIEKIKRGISKHKAVADALRMANEEVKT